MLNFDSVLKALNSAATGINVLVNLLSNGAEYFPWYVMQPAGKSLDTIQAINTPAAGTESTVLTYRVPIGYDGIIRRISNNYLGASFTYGALTWRIRVDGRIVDNYGSIQTELGTTEFARDIDGIFFSSGQTITYSVLNNTAIDVGTSVVCCIAGSYWPRRDPR